MKKLFFGAILGVASTLVYQKYLAAYAAPYVEKGKERVKAAVEAAKSKIHEATGSQEAASADAE